MSLIQSKREESQKMSIFILLKLAHYGLMVLAFYAVWIFFRYGRFTDLPSRGFRYNYFVGIIYAVILFAFDRTYNSYLLGYSRMRNMVFAHFLSQFFSAGIMWLGTAIAWNQWKMPWIFFPMIAVQLGASALWTKMANCLFYKAYPPKRTILIYRNELDKKRFGSVHGKPAARLYRIEKELRYEGHSFDDIRDQLEGYEAVFVAGVHSRCRNGIAKYCKEKDIPGFFLPHVGDVIMQEARHLQSFDSPVLLVRRKHLNPEYELAKRIFDIVSSFVAIVVFSPIMLVTALAIRLYDGGPAIYKQVRLTEGEREFKIYKFRSMRIDAEKDGVARLSSGDKDPRITPVGRIIRKCRLDELPQLFNILKGDMSVVGPRPERPEIAEQYYKELPDFRLRLQVKAGLTGYAQIYGKYNTDPYEKLEFDLLYINSMNFMTDLRLIFATFSILFSGESTEGIDANAVTAMNYDTTPDSAEGSEDEEDRKEGKDVKNNKDTKDAEDNKDK